MTKDEFIISLALLTSFEDETDFIYGLIPLGGSEMNKIQFLHHDIIGIKVRLMLVGADIGEFIPFTYVNGFAQIIEWVEKHGQK
ncbi:MAG: hypothetical protein HRU18_03115 [Pseudoalteromonas sp.]|uniref:hypothetical protein n=1 Tax=Pseudoalteromonas sp. TaxID=53249 RepID=UPI001E173B5B|nr:hypothetical protein [Pseudoalteromonas sp.]NRA77175.1 hypothetical protein [Pseudoalteromonas sp.]